MIARTKICLIDDYFCRAGLIHLLTCVTGGRVGFLHPRVGLIHPRVGFLHPRVGLIHPRVGLIHPKVGLIQVYG